jgi:lactoylglutathione lyase
MKKIFVFLFAALTVLSFDGMSQSASSPTVGLSLNHIAVYVHELNRSTDFYEKVLMLRKIDEPFKDGKHTWFTLGDAGQLHLIQGAEDFIANLDKHRIEYTNWPGTEKAPTVRVDGVKQIYFQDPDGHWIEINNEAR